MRANLPRPPYDKNELSDCFGFSVPASLVLTLNALCHDCATAGAAYQRVYDVLGWILADDDQRYQQTPPELFPIAATGVDGGHFGYMIRTPEIEVGDHPVARFEPMDFEGAFLVGKSTLEAIEDQISTQWKYAQDGRSRYADCEPWWPELLRRLAMLGVEPHTDKSERHLDGGFGTPVPAETPPGWRYVHSSDGAGVVASSSLFSPSPMPSAKHVGTLEVGAVLDLAKQHVTDSCPATALWLLRESYWQVWPLRDDDSRRLCTAMIEVYHLLGRPALAAVVERRMRFFR